MGGGECSRIPMSSCHVAGAPLPLLHPKPSPAIAKSPLGGKTAHSREPRCRPRPGRAFLSTTNASNFKGRTWSVTRASSLKMELLRLVCEPYKIRDLDVLAGCELPHVPDSTDPSLHDSTHEEQREKLPRVQLYRVSLVWPEGENRLSHFAIQCQAGFLSLHPPMFKSVMFPGPRRVPTQLAPLRVPSGLSAHCSLFHTEEAKSFSPRWVFTWLRRDEWSLKAFPQARHS